MIPIESLRRRTPFSTMVCTTFFAVGADRLFVAVSVLLLALVGMARLWVQHGRRTIHDAPSLIRYTITDLGTDGGRLTSVDARAINYRGQVAGGRHGAFLWENGRFKDLGTPDVCGCTGIALNNRGEIAGELYRHPWDKEPHVVILRGGKLVDTGIVGYAAGIDDKSRVVGHTLHRGRAFLYDNGKTIDLGSLAGGSSAAEAINDRGEIVGRAAVDQWYSHAFLYSGGKMHDLGTLGSKSSFADAINNKGWIVGCSQSMAFLYRDGKMEKLEGGMCVPRSINDAGIIVGSYQPDQQTAFAVVWIGGHLHKLQDLIPPNSGWRLYIATSINDRGQIAVMGVHAGERGIRSCILTPAEKGRPDRAGASI